MKKSKRKLYIGIIITLIILSILFLGTLIFYLNTSQIAISTSNALTSTSVLGNNKQYTEIQFGYSADCDSGSEFIDYGVSKEIIVSFSSLQDGFKLPRACFPEEEYLIKTNTNFQSTGSIGFLSSGELKEIGIINNESFCKVRNGGQLWESSPSGDCPYLPSGQRCTNGAIKTTRLEVYDCNIKAKYTCNNQEGCTIRDVCRANLQIIAYKQGFPLVCPEGEVKCSDGICRPNCEICTFTGCPEGYECIDEVCKKKFNITQLIITIISIVLIVMITGFVIYFIIKKLKKKR